MPNYGNQIIGRVGKIFATDAQEHNGKVFKRRTLWLDMTRCDPWTGERQWENWVELEAMSDGCDKLDQFKAGDIVKIQVEIQGRPYRYPADHPNVDMRGKAVIFNTIRIRDIELYRVTPQSNPVTSPQNQNNPPTSASSIKSGIIVPSQENSATHGKKTAVEQTLDLMDSAKAVADAKKALEEQKQKDAQDEANKPFPPAVDEKGVPTSNDYQGTGSADDLPF